MLPVNKFVGNNVQVHKIFNWIQSIYSKDDVPKYAVIKGNSGNGKTFLVELLAESFNAELFRITPADINKKDDFNDIIKSINISSLDNKKYKIILVDDIDNFSKKIRTKLYEISKISKYPVIYTTKTFSVDKDFYTFNKDAFTITLYLPERVDIINYINQKYPSKFSKETLISIIEKSKSFRSVILSLYNLQVNDFTEGDFTKKELLLSINQRNLKSNLIKGHGREDIKYVFDSIRGYDKDNLQVMMRFAEFDYRVRGKYEKAQGESYTSIDKFFVNNMKAPIEKIKLEYVYKKNNNISKNFKKVKKDLKVKSKKSTSSISKWI